MKADERCERIQAAGEELIVRAIHHAATIVKNGHACGGRCYEWEFIANVDEALRKVGDEGLGA